MMNDKFYRTLNDYNKEKFGQKVWRLPLDMGLPCPNIFTGGLNYHGKFEYISIEAMEKAVQTILKIIEIIQTKPLD